MSSGNLDLVRTIFAAWERGDFRSAEWAHPEVEYVHADGPAPGSWRGLAGMAEGFRDFLGAWEEWRVEADEYRELDGECVLVLNHYSARGKRSGVEIAQMRSRGASLFHLRDGKVTRLVNYFNRERALADLGRPSSESGPAEASPSEGPRSQPTVPRDDVSVEVVEDFVATVEIHRPPNNFFDVALIGALADAYEVLDRDPACRAIVLCSEGKHFCAGAAFGEAGANEDSEQLEAGDLYHEAVRLFAAATPVVAAVQGAAVGGGLGLALSADFRVASPETRFWANFARLGFHHGFGLTVTLPAAVGQQAALELLYTGRRVRGEEAVSLGLCDRLVPAERIRTEAHALAAEIATSAPLAVRSIRQTLRGDLAGRVRAATERERAEQDRLMRTDDFQEGVRAASERRVPRFDGH